MAAEILDGKVMSERLRAEIAERVTALKEKGIVPTLAIFRVGERADDLSYERGAMKRCEGVGVAVKNVVLPADVDSDTFFKTLDDLNNDPAVHGILMFRPLPKHLDSEKARKALNPAKDVDGCTDGSLAGVFTNTPLGFPPCTAQAAMEILDYYGYDCKGKRAAVIGRSLVVGRPLAMMLMHENATVVNCHTRTVDVPAITRAADILITASGRLHSVTKEYTHPGQVVIDVGINWDADKGRISGDVDFEDVEPCVAAITPVPGGVGGVTTCVLVGHVVEAAKRAMA